MESLLQPALGLTQIATEIKFGLNPHFDLIILT
jgi:hypothetical protein